MTTTIAPSQITLGEEQAEAVDKIRGWLAGSCHELTFSGAAGTGKSTVLGYLRQELEDAKCLFMAPTAKAAFVLQQKGLKAVTVHSAVFLYTGSYINWKDQECPQFREREDIKAAFEPDCFVVDETSMIDLDMAMAIRSKGKKILWTGDGNQLEPIGKNPHIIDNPDIRLEQVFRQGKGSPILDLAHHIRLGGTPTMRHRAPGDVDVVSLRHPKSIAKYAVDNNISQVIAGFNQTRHEVNRYMREALGLRGLLTTGDKLICRFNSRRHAIWNGMQLIVRSIKSEDEKAFTCDLQIDLGGALGQFRRDVRVQKQSLGNPNYKTSERHTDCVEFDYGHCVTCHAGQGSSWPSVLYLWQPCRNWSMARHGYTGVTRAETKLAVAV